MKRTHQSQNKKETGKRMAQNLNEVSGAASNTDLHQNEAQEIEEMIELEKLENNGKTAGQGGFKFRKSFFNQNITIVTGLSNLSLIEQASQDLLASHCDSLKKKVFVIGGDTKAHFPDVKITCTSHKLDDSMNESAKYFSVIIPTKMHPESQQFRYFLRRGVEKVDNETMIELSEDELLQIEEGFSKTFLPYLKKLNGETFSSIDDIPKKPDSIVLKDINERMKLTFRIDDFDSVGSGKSRIMPNVSIRIWEHGRNGWFMTKKGVTLSASNFHLFVSTTLGIFLDQVKSMFDNLQNSMMDVIFNFENNRREESEIEPFAN